MQKTKVIYHCYGGAHSSVVAAAIHLGQLKPDKVPSKKELMNLTLFDKQEKQNHGKLHFFGFDQSGCQVYSVGCRNIGRAVERALQGLAEIVGVDDKLFFVNTLPCVNLKMRIGGYLSRRLGLIPLGRPLVLQGTQEVYPQLVELVKNVQSGFEV